MDQILRVLLLEDNAVDAELMLFELRQSGFAPHATRVDTESGYAAQLDAALDLILADYSLPAFNAEQALALLQSRHLDVPFIVIMSPGEIDPA